MTNEPITITADEHEVLQRTLPVFLLMGIGSCSVSSDDSENPLKFSQENAGLFKLEDTYRSSLLSGDVYDEIVAELFPIMNKYADGMFGAVDGLAEYGEFDITLSLNKGTFELTCGYQADHSEDSANEYGIDELIGTGEEEDDRWSEVKKSLEEHGITSVNMELSGGGDSGGVDCVTYEPETNTLPNDSRKSIESFLEDWGFREMDVGSFDGNFSVSGHIKISKEKEDGEEVFKVNTYKNESYEESDLVTVVLEGPKQQGAPGQKKKRKTTTVKKQHKITVY